MDTELLKTFLEVSKTRHFGHAAENLYLTQSAVSFRIRQLESQLGNPLFIRQRGNVQLTGAGERLLPYADTILQMWGRAKQDVALTEKYNIQIAIGASSLLWEFDGISDWINRIYGAVPGLALRLESVPRHDLSKSLLERNVDIYITSEPPKVEHLQVLKVRDYQLQLVTHRPNCTMNNLRDIPLVYLDWGNRFAIEHGRVAELQGTPILHTHSSRMALDYIIANGGVGYLPAPVVSQSVEDGGLHLVEGAPTMDQGLYLVWREDNEKLELIKSILEVPLSMVAESV